MSYAIIRKTAAELDPSGEVALRDMLEDAFDGSFAPEDWQNAAAACTSSPTRRPPLSATPPSSRASWSSASVRFEPATWRRSPEEDNGVMILRTPSTRDLGTADRICCEERPGDAW